MKECRDDDCNAPYGRCNTTSETFACVCKELFKGKNCNIPVNPCLRNPCVHGTCRSQPIGNTPQLRAICTCLGGYTGEKCDIPSDNLNYHVLKYFLVINNYILNRSVL